MRKLRGRAAGGAEEALVASYVDGESTLQQALHAVTHKADAALREAIRVSCASTHGVDGASRAQVHAAGPAESFESRVLSLERLLPVRKVDIGRQMAAVMGALGDAPPSFQWGKPGSAGGAHPFTRLGLQMLPTWEGDEVSELHIYTDGSHTPSRTGWAFCVLAERGDGQLQFVGYSRGVALRQAATWATTVDPDNNVAELVAMFNALYWRTSYAATVGVAVPTSFHADNSLAYMGPALDAFSCKLGPLMVQVAAMDMVLRYMLWGAGACEDIISYKHVKGHSGHPWNEAADWLSTARADHLPVSLVGPSEDWASCPLELAAAVQLLRWASDGSGPWMEGSELVLQPSDPPALPPAMALGAGLSAQASAPAPQESLRLSVAVANVLSLAPRCEKDAGMDQLEVTSRMEELQDLLGKEGVHVAGVLESRLPGKGLRHTRDYFIISGGCKPGGTHGTQIWVSKALRPELGGRPVALQPKHFLVVEASPTRVLVSLQVGGSVLDLVALHAPHSGSKRRSLMHGGKRPGASWLREGTPPGPFACWLTPTPDWGSNRPPRAVRIRLRAPIGMASASRPSWRASPSSCRRHSRRPVPLAQDLRGPLPLAGSAGATTLRFPSRRGVMRVPGCTLTSSWQEASLITVLSLATPSSPLPRCRGSCRGGGRRAAGCS